MHTTEIVEFRKINDEQYSVLIRCCGNSATDHWHTMAYLADKTQRMANLDVERQKVAERHAAAIEAHAEAIDLMGDTQEHD